MRIPRALTALLATALLPVSVGVGAGVAAPAAASSNDIVIGVESPQTGDQASNGMDMLRGAQLAVRQVNAAGGVLGRHVRIVALDDQADRRSVRPRRSSRQGGCRRSDRPVQLSVGK
jgi:branched-chain amino acid transport system substrate-binding protein